MDAFMSFVSVFNRLVWGPWTLYVLLFAGLLFTLWTRFVQFKALTHGVAATRGDYDDASDPGAINHFQALSAALSATVGLGNIGGVAVAISLGGPGAVFWMWVVGFLGMALKTVEITLAMMYRNTSDPENPHGGAMWVIDKTLGARGGAARVLAKILGVTFSITLIIMTFAGGNMFQSWNVADLTFTYFGVPKVATGIVMAVLVGLVIIGGIHRIGQVAGKLVPVMCLTYLLSALAVLAMNAAQLPGLVLLVFRSAFGPTEAAGAFLGGSLGLAFQQGMKRALFSNEAGLGSSPIAHCAAKTAEPAREGLVGGLEPFIDTIVICTLTAMVILSTGTWNRGPAGPMKGEVALIQDGEGTRLVAPTDAAALPELPVSESWQPGAQVFLLAQVPSEGGETKRVRILGEVTGDALGRASAIRWGEVAAGAQWTSGPDGNPERGVFRDYTGATLTGHAFDRAFPGLGKWMVTLAAWMFAISTMISWSYYGEQGMIYMLGERSVIPYKFVYLALAVVGSFLVKTNQQLGDLADFGTGGMLLANMLIVLSMGYLAVRCLDSYFRRLNAGEFHPHKRPPIVDVVDGTDVEKR